MMSRDDDVPDAYDVVTKLPMTYRSSSQLCYPLICTIVGLAEEPPFDKHDKCLCPSVSDDPPFVPSHFWLVSFCFQ